MWHAYLVWFLILEQVDHLTLANSPPTAKIITTLLLFLLDSFHFCRRIAHVVFSRCSHHLRILNWNMFLPMTCWSAERTRLSIETFQAQRKKTHQECEGNIPLMEEILHQLVGGFGFSLYLPGFKNIPGGMFGISEPSTSSYSSFPILVEDLQTACTEAWASIARVISTNAGSANIDNKSQAFLACLPGVPPGLFVDVVEAWKTLTYKTM